MQYPVQMRNYTRTLEKTRTRTRHTLKQVRCSRSKNYIVVIILTISIIFLVFSAAATVQISLTFYCYQTTTPCITDISILHPLVTFSTRYLSDFRFIVFRLLLLLLFIIIVINIIIFLSFFSFVPVSFRYSSFFVSLLLRDYSPLIYCIIVLVPRPIYLSSCFYVPEKK